GPVTPSVKTNWLQVVVFEVHSQARFGLDVALPPRFAGALRPRVHERSARSRGNTANGRSAARHGLSLGARQGAANRRAADRGLGHRIGPSCGAPRSGFGTRNSRQAGYTRQLYQAVARLLGPHGGVLDRGRGTAARGRRAVRVRRYHSGPISPA